MSSKQLYMERLLIGHMQLSLFYHSYILANMPTELMCFSHENWDFLDLYKHYYDCRDNTKQMYIM